MENIYATMQISPPPSHRNMHLLNCLVNLFQEMQLIKLCWFDSGEEFKVGSMVVHLSRKEDSIWKVGLYQINNTNIVDFTWISMNYS